MKKFRVSSCEFPAETDWFDRWAQPLCTALLAIAASYFVGQVLYAWAMGRLVVR
jgi:hypothetical protein